MVIVMFWQNLVKFVLGFPKLWIIVSIDLCSSVICPLDPISNGMFLQLYPASFISSIKDAYLSIFFLVAGWIFSGRSKHTVSSNKYTVLTVGELSITTKSGLE